VDRWLVLGLLFVSVSACDNKSPAADLERLKTALACPPVDDSDANHERCRLFDEFKKANAFEAWPPNDAEGVWLGRQLCVGQQVVFPTVLRIKAGEADRSVVKINGFDGLSLFPYVVNDDSMGEFDVLQKAVAKGPPFSAPVIAMLKQPAKGVYFPLAKTEDGVRSPTGHWRAKDDRLLVVSYGGVNCAAELWRVP
jgi:hypothetical protein